MYVTSRYQLVFEAFETEYQRSANTEQRAFLPTLGPRLQFPEIPLEYVYPPLWIRCQLTSGIVWLGFPTVTNASFQRTLPKRVDGL